MKEAQEELLKVILILFISWGGNYLLTCFFTARKALPFFICCRETGVSGPCSYLAIRQCLLLPGILQFTSYLGVVTILPLAKLGTEIEFSQDHTAS